MTKDLDTLLIALYVKIDDDLAGIRRPAGRPPRLTDAELVCLAVAQALLGCHSEAHWLRVCYGRLGHLFRYLPKQPGYNKLIASLEDGGRPGPVTVGPACSGRRVGDAPPVC